MNALLSIDPLTLFVASLIGAMIACRKRLFGGYPKPMAHGELLISWLNMGSAALIGALVLIANEASQGVLAMVVIAELRMVNELTGLIRRSADKKQRRAMAAEVRSALPASDRSRLRPGLGTD